MLAAVSQMVNVIKSDHVNTTYHDCSKGRASAPLCVLASAR
jgi:hypothetical protein